MESLIIETLKIAALGFAIAVSSIFFTKSMMTKPIRDAADRRYPYIGYALKCTFCFIGWSSLALTGVYMPKLFSMLFRAELNLHGFNILTAVNFTVSWLALWGFSTWIYVKTWPTLKKNAPKVRIKMSERG